MTVLDEICARKRAHVAACAARLTLPALQERLAGLPTPRGFRARLAETAARGEPALITEIKRRSPSAGAIRADFNPALLAAACESGGATCLSVLTDGPYFDGRDDDLSAARDACALPVLRKDFMVDLYQIYESRLLGADCILLILAALDDAQAWAMQAAAWELGMDVLVEVHDAAELARATALQATLIGVNNRNLKTLSIDLATSERLADKMPAGVMRVAESGIRSAVEVARLRGFGYQAFLIGESVMRQADIAAAVAELRHT